MASRRKSICRSIIVAMLTVSLAPVIVLGLVSATFTSRQIETEQLQHDAALSQQIGRQIERVIAGVVEDLEILATNPRLIGKELTVAERRDELIRINRGVFGELSLLDASGFIIESTVNAVEIQDYSPWFSRARDDLSTFVSSPHRLTSNGELQISFYIPVDRALGSEVCVIKATLSFGRFGEILESVETGSGDFLVLMDDHGHVLESTDHVDAHQKFEAEGILARITESDTSRVQFDDGRSFYFVTQKVSPPNQLDADRPWTLTYFHEPGAVLATLHQSYFFQALAAGIGLIGAGLFGWLMTRRFTRPIIQLRKFAGEVASGNLGERVKIQTNDELGDLGKSLNRMAEKLGVSIEQKAELREKEVLLKEIHHRVKNNLQILSSMLRLQGRKVESEKMKKELRGSESRIRSMGLIHEKLYQCKSLSEIEFSGYARTLTGELRRMYTRNAAAVNLELDITDIRLGLDTALPCGLIINELVSNSLKYAFADGRSGHVVVKMRDRGEGAYDLVVSDNGVGAPEGGKLERKGSMGMRLVRMLVEQLNGEIQFSNGVGVTANIHFHETNYAKRV